MKWDRVSRRFVLQGLGGAVLSLPFLQSISPRSAQAAGPPKRFIALKTYNPQVIYSWYPAFKGNGYVLHNDKFTGDKADGTTLLSQPLVNGLPYTWAPLADFAATGVSTVIGKALTPKLDKLTLIRGLDFLPNSNHNYSGFLGNYSSEDEATTTDVTRMLPKWPTIDQILAYSPKFYPSTPAVRSIHVGQGITNGITWTDLGMKGGPVKQMQNRTNPLDLYNDLFASFTAGGAMPMDDGRALKDAAIMDRVRQDYVALKTNKRLSAADKQMLDLYTTLISELQGKLQNAKPPVTCAKPNAAPAMPNNTGSDPTDIRTRWNLFIDLIVAAIICDRTRIVTMDVRKALMSGGTAGLYHNQDGNSGWHGAAHAWGDVNARNRMIQANSWVASDVFLKLVEKLDVVEANGTTYLDNSLVYWGNELGFNHIAYSVPCLVAGSAGGSLKPGRYLDYINWNGKSYFGQEGGCVIAGIPHNRWCVTIMQAMGLAPEDYERNGKKGYGETTLIGKDPKLWATEYDMTAIGAPLPGISG